MRFKITIRGEGVELRGIIDGTHEELHEFAKELDPWVVIASVAADDYSPVKEQEMRELHHFEVEQILEKITATISNAPECEVHDDDDPITCGWKQDMIQVRKILDEWNAMEAKAR